MELREYVTRTAKLNEVIYNYELPLGVRLDAWAEWCNLFDAKEAADKARADECTDYAL